MGVKQKLQSITALDRLYTKWKWRERKISYGEKYPDQVFFVVRRAWCKAGLFSHVMTNMGLVDYALKRGYIPVIDMQNGRNTYLEDDKIGKENAWEYFFEQPCGCTLEDVKGARHVILSDGLITEKNDYPDFRIMADEERFAYWHRFFQKYFRVRANILTEYEQLRREMLGDAKTLGILARGTDYVSAKPKGHPIQPTAEQIIRKAREVTVRYSCEKIYLATEDAGMYGSLKEAFGKKLTALDTERYVTSGQQNINDLGAGRDKLEKGKDYLLSIMLLADCDCLVAGNAGGTHGAVLMSRGYEYQYIFDLGMYD